MLTEKRRLSGWRLGAGFFEARARRLRYTELWKRAQSKPWLMELNEREASELRTMERDVLAVEDVVAFRAIGRVHLMAEEEAHKAAHEAAHKAAAASGVKVRKSWYEWATGSEATGGAAGVGGGEVPAFMEEIRLSDEQRSKLSALLSGGAEAAARARVCVRRVC